ncbi:MAG: hypothetical protein IKN27_09795, partial [Selenomonadaceae bacterium]|nr:hypothetical protein [Selenomonadaceae bacterium]
EAQASLEEMMTPDPMPEVEAEVNEEPFTPFTEEPTLEVEEQPADIPTLSDIPVVNEMPTFDEQPAEDKIAAMTQQAEELKSALQKAMGTEDKPKSSREKAVDERRRRVLLGKHATKTIMADSGTIVVEAGAEVTEEVLQRARLSNKFIELSMNVQYNSIILCRKLTAEDFFCPRREFYSRDERHLRRKYFCREEVTT